MPTTRAEIEAAYLKARRAVIYDVIFVLVCLVVAMVIRRMLSYPPVLTWLVFAVPAVVFAGDFIRMMYYRFRLSRLTSDP